MRVEGSSRAVGKTGGQTDDKEVAGHDKVKILKAALLPRSGMDVAWQERTWHGGHKEQHGCRSTDRGEDADSGYTRVPGLSQHLRQRNAGAARSSLLAQRPSFSQDLHLDLSRAQEIIF